MRCSHDDILSFTAVVFCDESQGFYNKGRDSILGLQRLRHLMSTRRIRGRRSKKLKTNPRFAQKKLFKPRFLFSVSFWILAIFLLTAVTLHDFGPKYLTLPVFCQRQRFAKSAICEYVRLRDPRRPFFAQNKIYFYDLDILSAAAKSWQRAQCIPSFRYTTVTRTGALSSPGVTAIRSAQLFGPLSKARNPHCSRGGLSPAKSIQL